MLTLPVAAPLSAFCMACILFVYVSPPHFLSISISRHANSSPHRYARTSIQAAKRNAQMHRDADGGQISWRNESLRRHGALPPPEEQSTVAQLLKGAKDGAVKKEAKGGEGITEEEERVRERAGRGR